METLDAQTKTQVNETESPISDDNQSVENPASQPVEPEQAQDLNLFESQTPDHNSGDVSKEPSFAQDGVNLDEASLVPDSAGQNGQLLLGDSLVYQDLPTNSDAALASGSQLLDPGKVDNADEQGSVDSSIDAVSKVDIRPKVLPENNFVRDEAPDSNDPDLSPSVARPAIPAEILEKYDVGESWF